MSDTTISIVPISKAAQRTVNPIRSIVDGLRIQPHPDKHMISLALGMSYNEVILTSISSSLNSFLSLCLSYYNYDFSALITLALGDPTLFGNFQTAPLCTQEVIQRVQSLQSNGYPPSTG